MSISTSIRASPHRRLALTPVLQLRSPSHRLRLSANPKMQEFREMSEEQILTEVEECKKQLFQLRIDQALGKSVKTHMFKVYRKKAAQLLTVKRQKEIEQGINKRQSRKKEKNRLLREGAWVR
eukprot:g6204.t1